MYYMLECYGPDEEDAANMGDWPQFEGVNWLHGRPIDRYIPTPIEILLDLDQPGIMLPMFYSGVLVFSDAMIAALHRAGVNNFECFDAVLKDTVNGVDYTNYKVINIIGLVAAANLEKSVCDTRGGEPLIDVYFDSLVLNENKIKDLYMFRLAECVTGIVIHEKVKQALEEDNIKHLDFILPEEWIG
ncbi:MAG TPA: hypothetical protein VN030_08365 [Cellvibrio sp.]|nr:hypothetical protein [Cellvibrio sp.]